VLRWGLYLLWVLGVALLTPNHCLLIFSWHGGGEDLITYSHVRDRQVRGPQRGPGRTIAGGDEHSSSVR
jgi:hypothetical protein